MAPRTPISHRLFQYAISLGVVLALAAAFLSGTSVSAQVTAAHPAHIHEGSCPTPGKVVFPLSDVSEQGIVQGTPLATPSPVGQTNAMPVNYSAKTVDSSLSDLADGNHAIAIHESATDITKYLVCGNIGGAMIGDSDLAVGLSAVDNSGYLGIATLHDNGNGTTTVYLLLTSPAGGASTPAAQATPVTTVAPVAAASPTTAPAVAASPTTAPAADGSPTTQAAASAGQAPTTFKLEMVDIAFKPKDFTIAANTDVTVTLDDTGAILHNFSVDDHNNPNVKNLGISVDVNPGETKTVTINAPAGDYYYYCNVPGHEAAGMFGAMHVK